MAGEKEPEATGDGTPIPPEGERSPLQERRRRLVRLVGPSLAAVLAVWLMVMLLGILDQPEDDESGALPTPSGGQTSGERDRETGSATPSGSPLSSPLPMTTDGTATNGTQPAEDGTEPNGGAAFGAPSGVPSPLITALSGAADKSGIRAVSRPLPVYVLNQTTRRELAAEVAEDIESAGWSIAKVSWWRGVVPSTTVYYPPGHEEAARALSAAFPAIGRVRPRVAPMPDDALTVILCKEYPET
jgi:LytR cell envelope-related transcriptional attenuator